MKMNTEGENTAENQDSKFTSPSPSTQSEISADGDNCSGQSLPSDNDKAQTATTVNNVSHSEPKAKKRRKQSNPIKCPNVLTSDLQPPIDDVDLNEGENEIIQDNKRFKEDNEAHVKCNHQVEVKPNLHNDAKKADTVSSQQTSTLHSVTSALFNNKMREIERSHAVTVSAKESSLQSSTDVSSPDSNEGLLQNSEPKISLASMFPQMPPLLPLNSVDLTGDVSKIPNIFSPFSEVSLPHPPTSLGLVQSNRNFTNSSGMRIFNPEAYCELCEKEFCNKYFLKTHKANKHGITTVDSPSSFAYRTSFKGMPVTSPGNLHLISQVNENGSGTNFADNYCNICQKTFCNKYFLKKHRLNIHGINDGSSENPGTVPNSIHVPVISSPLPPSKFHSTEVKSEDNSVDLSTSDNSALKPSNVDVKTSNFSSSSSSGIVTSNSNCSTDFSMEGKGKALVLNLHVSDNKNEKYLCELCNIEFTDRRYLESHRKNRHGADVVVKVESKSPDLVEGVASGKSSPDQTNESKDAFREQTCTPCMKTFTSADAFQAHMFETHGRVKDEDKANDVNHKVSQSHMDKELKLVDSHMSNTQLGKKLPENESSNSSSDSGMFSCNICSTKCKDRSSLNIHLESEHSLHEKFASRISTMFGIGDMSMFAGSLDSSVSCSICQENFSDRNQLRSHLLRCHSVFSPNTDASSEVADGDSLRKLDSEFYMYANDRQKSVGGRNYCIICNKELCNKYFMKTHMWKMHGIDVDKLAVSGKTASTAGGVFCNICQKVLCSKYFLKVHKQNVHGIFEDVPRTPAAFSTLLGGEASQKDINDEKASEDSIQKQNQSNFVNNQFVSDDLVGNAQRNSGFSCEICAEEFPSKIFLQIHLVNKHVNNNDSKGTNLGKILGLPSGSPQLLTVNAGLLSHHGVEQLNDLRKEIPRCSCCVYLGKEAPITNISEKQPSQVNSNEENKFHCHICNVSYEFADYFKHHKSHINQALALQSDAESGQILSDLKTRNKMRPRKFKRFRCSKCDKKFRTKEKCLRHIQVTHKSKKGINQSANDVQAYDCTVSFQKEVSSDKVSGFSKGASVGYEKDATESLLKDDKRSANHSVLYQSPSLPVPYVMPENSPNVIMQPFHLSEPKAEGVPKQDVFVPSLVYLPVNQKVSEPITVAFTLTPA